jgi:hypothetical protein
MVMSFHLLAPSKKDLREFRYLRWIRSAGRFAETHLWDDIRAAIENLSTKVKRLEHQS